MEYTIPQELNREDRIGPFTIAQMAIIGITLLLVASTMVMDLPTIVTIIVAVLLSPVMLFFMYKKYYTIPVYEFVVVYLVYIATPRLLIYRTDNVKDEFYEEGRLIITEEDEDEFEFEGSEK